MRSLRMNQIQTIATHNSYHVRPPAALYSLVRRANSETGEWDYSHAPLDVQLDRGVRSFELDVHNIASGFEVFHLPHLDETTTCRKFTACCELIKDWSLKNPRHVPIIVLVEIKDEAVQLSSKIRPIDEKALDRLDAEIRSVLGPDDLITPDDVRGDASTLEEAITIRGWPLLDDVRGKIMFILHEGGSNREMYVRNRPSLQGRAMFIRSDEGRPDAATLVVDGPDLETIQRLVKKGYIVRTRADAGLHGDPKRRDTALSCGAQIVSSDFPPGEANATTGYCLQFPERLTVRANPVIGPPELAGVEIDGHPSGMEPAAEKIEAPRAQQRKERELELKEYPMQSIAPTVTAILGLKSPEKAEAGPMEAIVKDLAGVERVAVLGVDAMGISIWRRWRERMPYLSGMIEKNKSQVRAIMISKTPVNFSCMVTGARSEVSGIYEKTDSFACETVFDIVRAAGGKSAGMGRRNWTGDALLGRFADFSAQGKAETDAQVEEMLRNVIEGHLPRFVICQYGDTDEVFHAKGPYSEQAGASAAGADAWLSRMVPYLTGKGYGVIILADHGQHEAKWKGGGLIKGSHGDDTDEDRLVPLCWTK